MSIRKMAGYAVLLWLLGVSLNAQALLVHEEEVVASWRLQSAGPVSLLRSFVQQDVVQQNTILLAEWLEPRLSFAPGVLVSFWQRFFSQFRLQPQDWHTVTDATPVDPVVVKVWEPAAYELMLLGLVLLMVLRRRMGSQD